MVTLVLEPSEVEHGLKANTWSNRGRHIMAGSWSKGRNNVLQIKLKMTFASTLWSPVFFEGHFDPKRDALTGSVRGASANPDSPSGRMEFRRIPPCYLTVYPSIKELSHNRPRASWRFAIAAVRNDVRRDSWSWSFFSQRRDDRETVISLTTRSLYFGKRLDDNESEELCEAVQRLTPADACFYSSKINRIRAHTRVHV
jgi:Vacuolar sorting-associated protein 13, N-terminal